MLPIDTLLYWILTTAFIAGVVLIYWKRTPASIPKDKPLQNKQPGEFVFEQEVPTQILEEKEEPDLSSHPLAITEEPARQSTPMMEQSPIVEFGPFDPRLDLSSYRFPRLNLLEPPSLKHELDAAPLEENKRVLVTTLAGFGIRIDRVQATLGPNTILYELLLSPGTRISQVKKLEPELGLCLAASGLQVLGHIPGTGNLGIEVPRKHPDIVSIRSLLSTDEFQNATMELPVVLGRNKHNQPVIVDLTTLPHLLIAGATGQGKSVCINAILTSLLYKKHPIEVKFVLIDIKQLELSLYQKISRHFLAGLPNEKNVAINTIRQASDTLNSLCMEMDQRYDLLKDAGVRDIQTYNAQFINRILLPNKGHRYLPYIVLVIDEIADLVKKEHPENERFITRLSQLGRAVRIHLVVSTQLPSSGIIAGSIKTNFTARIAFRLPTSADSQAILDNRGAEQLKGNGDLLFSNGTEIIRLQGAYVSTADVENICSYIGLQAGYANITPLPDPYLTDQSFGLHRQKDPLFEEAARLIVLHQQGSTSLIQRKLRLNYNRAGLIIDQLEAADIVGPFEGSKAREVLIPDDDSLERHLAVYFGDSDHPVSGQIDPGVS